MVYVLYNSTAGSHYGVDRIRAKMEESFTGEEISLSSTLSIDDKKGYIERIGEGDRLVIVGGDGTLNRFANGIEDKEYPFPIYCYAAGTGNDFINDVTGVDSDALVMINDYIKELPVATVNGKDYKFINGVGFGIDGYCCDVGEQVRQKCGKAPNYTKIAIKGLLGAFKTVNAKITVDGVTREYKNCWMAPTMNGRYFGGGMMITPEQDRLNKERTLSIVAVHAKSRLRLLTVFPKIFKGTHVKYTNMIEIVTGKEVSIEFDKPTSLQIDGETIRNVTTYSAKSFSLVKEESERI